MSFQDPSTRRRRLWPWVLFGVVCAPLVLLGAAVVNCLTLDRDAAALRREVMRATGADWSTNVQFSVGRASLSALRGCLSVISSERVDDARQVLAAVRSASVGVYQLRAEAGAWPAATVLGRADGAMRARGWERAIGVIDRDQLVLVYVPADADDLDELCLAVVNGRELVVVGAELREEHLIAVIERRAGEELRLVERLRRAKIE